MFLLLSWQPRLLYLRAARGLEQFVPIKVGTKWAVKPGGDTQQSPQPPFPLARGAAELPARCRALASSSPALAEARG